MKWSSDQPTARVPFRGPILNTINSYLKHQKAGDQYPAAATVRQLGEDAGNVVKYIGDSAAKLVEFGVDNAKELSDLVK